MTPASQVQVVEAMSVWLEAALGGRVRGAFIYGSVAAGTASADSDIDFFVVLHNLLAEGRKMRLNVGFAQLQIELGYRPDLNHPIEMFSAETCRSVIQVGTPRGRAGEALLSIEDRREILRALTQPRLIVLPSQELDEFTSAVRAIVEG